MTDARPHIAAIKTALNATCTATVYEYDGVPGANDSPGIEPANYVVFSVERRFGGILKGSARSNVIGWRVAVRGVGENANNAEQSLAEASTALNEAILAISGESTTSIQFEVSQAVTWNDGRYSGLDTYTYAI